MPSIVIHVAVATIILASRTLAVRPQVVKWSDKSYGPDGPWSAVTVEIGTPAQKVDLLPGGSWMTNVFTNTVCEAANPADSCAALKAGLYDYESSETFVQIGGTGQLKGNFNKNPGSIAAVTEGEAGWIFDKMVIQATEGGDGFTVPIPVNSFSMLVFASAQMSQPDGLKYTPTIGKLALGSPNKNQTWQNGRSGQFNGTLLTSALFEQGRTPSDSYSLHVGSADMKIAGSLVLGGYHKDRALGSVSIQPYAFDTLPIDLLDIEMGVADGESPFNFTAKSGLLAEGDATLTGGQQVTIDATQPYLYLPPTTCKAIASHLPVTFDERRGLYFWNEKDPNTEKIVKSPAFLAFKFRDSGSVTKEMRIKVPFSLLYLTLSSPIITTGNKKYFPCYHGQDPTGFYSLGRSFMQAAMVGVKWETGGGNWFLAQAPGPNTPKTITPLPIENAITSSNTRWEDTWKGFWNVTKLGVEDGGSEDDSTDGSATFTRDEGVTATLGGSSPTSTSGGGGKTGFDGSAGLGGNDGKNGEDGSSSSPPIGAIAGGVVGSALLFGVALFAFIFFRRRNSKATSLTVLPKSNDSNTDYYEFKAELDGTREMAEMEGKSYQGRFGQEANQEWKGNRYAQHGQNIGHGLGLGHIGGGPGGRVVVREMHEMPAATPRFEMYAPWSPKGI